MLDWMAAQIHGRYGLNLATCKEWLQRDEVVPLLDGLDELGKGRIREAIAAIDALQEDYQQQPDLVICCRIQDYREAIAAEKEGSETRYHLRGVDRAVRLCELSEVQIRHYLQQRDAENLWEDLRVRSGFWELAKNPMLLNLLPIAYPERLPENAPEDPETCQSLLFDAFLHRKLNPAQRTQSGQLEDYKPKEARYYLAWLAASMEREGINQREFLIEKLQPTWLENQRQWQRYRLIVELIVGLKAELKIRTKPNQGIWETAIQTLITIGLAMFLSPLIVIVPALATGREFTWLEAAIQGGGGGIFIGFVAGGGIALIQHFALRLVLTCEGKMPWDYAKFLSEASNIGILKQSGGRYRFYHDKLREHLAEENNIVYKKAYQPKESSLIQSTIAVLLVLVLLGLSSGISTISTDSISNNSLYPVVQAKDTLFSDFITYRFRSIQRHHIVAFTASESLRNQGFTKHPSYIRRIIALPDETLEIRQGRIFIDDEPLEDTDIKMPENFERSRITLDSDEYYVMGNNPDYTNLETFGAIVSRQDIRGQVIMRIYPFDRMGFIR